MEKAILVLLLIPVMGMSQVVGLTSGKRVLRVPKNIGSSDAYISSDYDNYNCWMCGRSKIVVLGDFDKDHIVGVYKPFGGTGNAGGMCTNNTVVVLSKELIKDWEVIEDWLEYTGQEQNREKWKRVDSLLRNQ